ncbi:hypothetical protein CDG77_12440 [Nostoc sp. 'Peltigera membranacea cyanobiont' 213]|nr:hypothetical protein CDG77_12440 [Nostoc sp. 'Peltigera membranacea cyanobiont' 213]
MGISGGLRSQLISVALVSPDNVPTYNAMIATQLIPSDRRLAHSVAMPLAQPLLEDVLKVLLSVSKVLDPPKSTPHAPLKKGDFDSDSPLFKGSQRGLGGFPHERLAWVRGDLRVPKITAKYFSNNL